MANNYNKSFNFRKGVQVDGSSLVVNSNGLVGVGTSAPTEIFDVRGTAKIVGLVTSNSLYVSDNATVEDSLSVGSDFIVSAGVITATAINIGLRTVTQLVGYATDAWIIDPTINGISTTYSVGIGTTIPSSKYDLLIGQDPDSGEGIAFTADNGNVKSSGIITAFLFKGDIPSTELTGTIPNERFAGIITSNLEGDVVGIATTARGLIGTPDIEVGIATIRSLAAAGGTIGIATVTDVIHVSIGGSIGVGTAVPTADLQIFNNENSGISSNTSLELVSVYGSSRISLGQTGAVGIGSSYASLIYGLETGTLDIANNETGNIRMIIDNGESSGINTGAFTWHHASSSTTLMHLDYEGNLGIGGSATTNGTSIKLRVGGGLTATDKAYFGNSVDVIGTLKADTLEGSYTFPDIVPSNLYKQSGVTTVFNLHVFDYGNEVGLHSVGIGSTLPEYQFDARLVNCGLGRVAIGDTAVGRHIGDDIDRKGFGHEEHVLECRGYAKFDRVGIGTTDAPHNQLRLNDSSIHVLGNSGNVYIENGILTVGIKPDGPEHSVYPGQNAGGRVGINTRNPRSILDVGCIGISQQGAAIILPNVTETQMNAIDSYDNNTGQQAPAKGSIVFCTNGTNANKFMGWNGSSWVVLG